MTRRRILRRREREHGEGAGLTHFLGSRSRSQESKEKPPYPIGTPEYMAWVRSFRKEKRGGRKQKLRNIPKEELWELKLKGRDYDSIVNYLYRHY